VQIIEWTLDGIASRSWMGVANAHGAASFDGITFLSTTDDGTITDVHVYFDVASVKVQLRAASEKLANHPIPKETSASTDIVKAMDTSEETENVAVVRAMLDSLERRDDAAYVRSLADSIEESVPDRALTLHGKDEVRGRTKALIRAISQLDTTIHSANGADRFVVVEYTLSGVLVGPLGFLAPTNRVVTLHVVDVIEMGEGKVISLREYGNFAEVLSSGS
jgi:ketosteroid isomerase-like protein